MKIFKPIGLFVLSIAMTGCNSQDDDTSTGNSAETDTPTDNATSAPVPQNCIFAATDNPSSRQCSLQDGDPPAYTEVNCTLSEVGKTWVRAYPANPSDIETWVLVPSEDDVAGVDSLPGAPIVHPPSLIYSPGPSFERRVCNFEPITIDTCPGSVDIPTGDESVCVGEAAGNNPGPVGISQ